MLDQEPKAINVFFSYAHNDGKYKIALEKHLSLLERDGYISGWSDRDIQAGQEREGEIDRHLNNAQIILLLISPDFLASDHCYSVEMKQAMERHEAGEARVIPIILRPVDWEASPFSKLQVLPRDGKPITRRKNHDEAFLDVVQDIRRVVQEFRTQPDHSSFNESYRVDWGEAPDIGQFYGRERELTAIKRWVVDEHCHMAAVLGIGGIGKSSLVATLVEQVKESFDYVFGRSLRDAPPLQSILQDCIPFISDQRQIELPEDVDKQLSLLFRYLRKSCCLLILDNFESVLQAGSHAGQYREGREAYGKLLQRVGQARHQSCLLLTSREKPKEVADLDGVAGTVRSFPLAGLSVKEGQKILENKGLFAADDTLADLVHRYSGNPLALKLVAVPIKEMFQDDIARFLKEDTTIVSSGIYDLLDKQFHRLSEAEQDIIYWLAIEREPVSLDTLGEDIVVSISKREVLDALQSLRRRSMIETSGIAIFTLQPVIMEYVTESFVERACQELATETIGLFGSHALMKAQSQDYVRESQVRLILMPVAQPLHARLGQEAFEEKCKQSLSQLRAARPQHAAYAAGNILNMLIQLGYDLHQYDFSHLALWQAYLREASLHDVDFAFADFVKPLFTDTFGGIMSVAFSPDGNLLAGGTANGEIRLWDTASGALIHAFRSNPDWIRSVAFSPDGTIVASGSEDKTVRLWDASSGQCRKILWHTNTVSSVAFNTDGKLLASAGQDGFIKLWDVSTGEPVRTLSDNPEQDLFWSVAISPDGKLIASGSEDKTVRLWDASTGQLLHILKGHARPVFSVSFSPDGKLIASGSEDKTVRLWDASTGQPIKRLKGHTDWVWSVVFTADGKILASGGEDHTVRLWDISSGLCLKTLRGHTNNVWSVASHPNQHILASGSTDQAVRLWDVSGGWCLKSLQGYTNGIFSVAFSPDGKTLASGSEDKMVRLWDVKTGQCRKTLRGHLDRIWSVAFSPDGRKLVSGSTEALRIWDDLNGDQHRTLPGHTSWVYCATFSPDGKMIASGSDDGSVRLWDVSSGNHRILLEEEDTMVCSVAFSPDGKRLVSGREKVCLWDLSASEQPLMTTMDCIIPIWSVAFSPDGQFIVGGGEGHAVYLWDANTGQCLKTLSGHSSVITAVAFSPDKKTIASGGDDYTVRLWDVDNEQRFKILQGHTDRILTVAFHPNGRTIASGSQDGTIKLWNTKTGKCLRTLRSDRPYERMNITGVSGLTVAQKAMLRTLGAIEHEGDVP